MRGPSVGKIRGGKKHNKCHNSTHFWTLVITTGLALIVNKHQGPQLPSSGWAWIDIMTKLLSTIKLQVVFNVSITIYFIPTKLLILRTFCKTPQNKIKKAVINLLTCKSRIKDDRGWPSWPWERWCYRRRRRRGHRASGGQLITPTGGRRGRRGRRRSVRWWCTIWPVWPLEQKSILISTNLLFIT